MSYSIEYNPDELTTYIYDGTGAGRQLIRQVDNSTYALDTGNVYVVVSEAVGSTVRESALIPIANSIILKTYTSAP